MGLAPSELWGMCLWEYNLCVRAYNHAQEDNTKIDFYRAHTTAALTAQGFAGKLRQASYYLPDIPEDVQGEELTDEQMEAIDRELRERDKKKD